MVFHSKKAEIHAANQHMIGKMDYLTGAFKPDNCNAVRVANLQPGERVLDLGIGSGTVLAAAKTAVKEGICVGIEAVQELLEVDVLDTLTRANLTVAPAGTDDKKVYLINENVTNGALAKVIRDCIGLPAKQLLDFNVIFLLNVFNTIPPAQRRQTLLNLKGMLADNGRIIMSVSARFGAPNEVQGILQFSLNNLTEAPGCVVSSQVHRTAFVTTANGQCEPTRTIFSSTQLAPDELWQVALEQAVAAADNVGLRVISSLPFGKGDQFGLAATAPAMPKLDGMTSQDLVTALNNRPFEDYDCLGPLLVALVAVEPELWLDRHPRTARDFSCVKTLQDVAAKMVSDRNDDSREKMLKNQHSLETLTFSEHQQVGVLVELRRK